MLPQVGCEFFNLINASKQPEGFGGCREEFNLKEIDDYLKTHPDQKAQSNAQKASTYGQCACSLF